jgi:phenylalanyl-tRNA synthetase beta chain
VQAALGAPERVAIFELDLDVIGGVAPEPLTFRALPRFPAVTRDLALSLPEGVPEEAVEKVIRAAAGELLEEVRLFDVYSGPNLAKGHRSLAFALSFRAVERTLTDAEVDAVVARVVTRVEGEVGAQLRR